MKPPSSDKPQPAIFAAPKADARAAFSNDLLGFEQRKAGFAAHLKDGPAKAPPPAVKPAAVAGDVAAQTLANALARTLARREWLLDVAERQRALSPRTGGIPRVRGIGSDEFLDRFYAPGRPVVIEGELDGWPALGRWTPAYLRQAVGSALVEYQGGRDADPQFELYKDRHKRAMPFDRFIDAIDAEHPSNDAYITAYNSAANGAAFAPLMRDLGTLERFLRPGGGMLWIGPAGTFTPLHFDLTNNLLAQVTGTKQVILLPPSETMRLANARHVFSEVHDVTDPERLARFPAAADARRFAIELNPGDLLYIPIGWWHQVRSTAFSVMLTYTNFRWPNEGHATFPAG